MNLPSSGRGASLRDVEELTQQLLRLIEEPILIKGIPVLLVRVSAWRSIPRMLEAVKP